MGYVDARAAGANEAARKIADEQARTFKCGADNPNGDGSKKDGAPKN